MGLNSDYCDECGKKVGWGNIYCSDRCRKKGNKRMEKELKKIGIDKWQ